MKKWYRVAGLLAIALLLAASMAVAAPAEKSKSYVVGLVHGASAQSLVTDGVTLVSEWPDLDAAQVVATAPGKAALQQNPNVLSVEEDSVRVVQGGPAVSAGDEQVAAGTAQGMYSDGGLTWGLQAVKAQDAWNLGATGQGVKVCILDTGIDASHPEFTRPDGTSVIAAVKNFTDSATTFSVHPHGTHVAGTIAGQTSASGSRIGVAPGVDLYIAKVLGDTGSGYTSWIINGLKWCEEQGANIASLSLGSDQANGIESKAFHDAYENGMLIVAAAGNAGNLSLSYPAGYERVISIAAVDNNLQKASFSQFNSDVELSAPGVSTLSSVPVGTGLTTALTVNGQAYKNAPVSYSPKGNVTGPLVECGLATTTTSCAGHPTDGPWVALINRGSITFGAKVTNAMAQGASAAIIVNNDKANPNDVGSFTLGAAGNWIPTVSTSYNNGVAIRAAGLGTGTVSLSAWNYDYYQGTSMATPHASAVAALAWSANPSLTNEQIRDILSATALHLGKEVGRNFYYGNGLVQADAAVLAARATH